jgi:CubicO group peptidase (beta-lactamase class C family)
MRKAPLKAINLTASTMLGLVISVSVFSQQNDDVEAFLKSEMRESRIPGMQVAVVQQGKIVLLKSFGTGNIQYSVPVTDQSIFSINSCTKAFTGVAVMQLVEDGKLDVAEPVSRYLQGLPAAWQSITIRQLLTHVSGLPNIVADDNTGRLVGAGGQDAAWEKVLTMPMEFVTGERYQYNQTNYVILGKIIDKLSGKPFAQFFKERQFEIANMSNTGFGDSRDVVTDKTQSYRYYSSRDGIALENEMLCNVYEEFSPFRRTASGINSTAEDLARWIIALQNFKLIKSKTLIDTLWTPGTLNDGLPTLWSLGWKTINRPKHPVVAATGGSRSAFYIYPEDDLAIVILTNLVFANPEQLMDAVAGYYIPDLRFAHSIHLLRTELLQQGFENTIKVANDLKRKSSGLLFVESDVNNWGYRLFRNDQKKEALEIFKLNVYLFPGSSNVYDSLAETYAALGETVSAIENYEHSLKLDPKNTNAANQLRRLKSK